MSDNKSSPLILPTATLACCCVLVFNFLLTSSAIAVTSAELQQERATLQAYERRIPRLLTQMRGLDHQLEKLHAQREAIELDLSDLTRTYLIKQKAHEQARSDASTTDDKDAQAKLEHARFQYYLVERKLTNMQNEVEQLDKSIAPLKQSLQEKQRQLQQSEKGLAFQREHVRKLASAPRTTVERIEIRSSNRNKGVQPELQANAATTASTLPATMPTSASDTSKVEIATARPLQNADQEAIAKDRQYAQAQAQRLQEVLASKKPGKPSGNQPKTLEVQHKDASGTKHFYDFAYAGADQYTTEGTVHAGKQVFKVARQRWVTNIPEYDDGANYVFILNAAPHRRLELFMYNAALVE